MFRSIVVGCLLALAAVAPPAGAEVVGRTMSIRLPGMTGVAICLSEEGADSMLAGMPWGPALCAEREQWRTELRRQFGHDVMLITVLVYNDSTSQAALRLDMGDTLNIRRQGEVMNGFGILYTITVKPGESGYTFAVFGRFRALRDDEFYYHAKPPRE